MTPELRAVLARHPGHAPCVLCGRTRHTSLIFFFSLKLVSVVQCGSFGHDGSTLMVGMWVWTHYCAAKLGCRAEPRLKGLHLISSHPHPCVIDFMWPIASNTQPNKAVRNPEFRSLSLRDCRQRFDDEVLDGGVYNHAGQSCQGMLSSTQKRTSERAVFCIAGLFVLFGELFWSPFEKVTSGNMFYWHLSCNLSGFVHLRFALQCSTVDLQTSIDKSDTRTDHNVIYSFQFRPVFASFA